MNGAQPGLRTGRRRPLWLVAALSLLTLGAYVPIWFGLTWAEIKSETKDERMLPLGHALATLVPGANGWIAWRHFGAINGLLEKAGRPERVDALSGALGLVIWWLTFTHYSSDPVFLALDAVELLAGTAVVVYGQRGLNAYWATLGAVEKLLETDLIVLAVAGTYAVFTLVGFFTATP
ncbi:MAG TPA: hypothetical protein VK197_04205 [Verrucomicrobiae bacterium]|nr:hypothetical protein [Verrucomicrobiae bacterium]